MLEGLACTRECFSGPKPQCPHLTAPEVITLQVQAEQHNALHLQMAHDPGVLSSWT